MKASDQYNVNTLKRHIIGEIELQGGFHNIRQCSHPEDLIAVAWARDWYEGHCYGEEHGEDAVRQLFHTWWQQASYDDE
mgnify:CR=1 FL=1